MQIDKRTIESSLLSKGFIQKNGPHRYFFHVYAGRETGISTHTSHGSKYKTYGIELLDKMKKQLGLTLPQLKDLLLCPMKSDQYNQILKSRGVQVG